MIGVSTALGTGIPFFDGSGDPPGVIGRTDSPIAFSTAAAMSPPRPGVTLRTSAMTPSLDATQPSIDCNA